MLDTADNNNKNDNNNNDFFKRLSLKALSALHGHDGGGGTGKQKLLNKCFSQTLHGGGGFVLACEEFGRMLYNSFNACSFCCCFLSVYYVAHTNCTLYARISPQWLSELRRLLPNVPDELCVSSFPDRFPHYAWTAA